MTWPNMWMGENKEFNIALSVAWTKQTKCTSLAYCRNSGLWYASLMERKQQEFGCKYSNACIGKMVLKCMLYRLVFIVWPTGYCVLAQLFWKITKNELGRAMHSSRRILPKSYLKFLSHIFIMHYHCIFSMKQVQACRTKLYVAYKNYFRIMQLFFSSYMHDDFCAKLKKLQRGKKGYVRILRNRQAKFKNSFSIFSKWKVSDSILCISFLIFYV